LEGNKVYGENNFCTRAYAMYYCINEGGIPLSSEFYDWRTDGTINSYNVERSYVELLSYSTEKEDVCFHGNLFHELEHYKEDIDKYSTLENAILEETLDYYNLANDVVEDKKHLLTDMGPGKENYKYKYVEKVHDGQVKNMMAYLDFINYYKDEFNEIRNVYVVGCGGDAYMYTFLGYYFYDKRVFFYR